MLGMPKYNPTFFKSTQELINNCSKDLTTLIGKIIAEVWIVWDENNNEWFNDCPVVLNIEGQQIELCAFKFDEFAVTFNEIDLSNKLDWYGVKDFDLEWRKACLQQFKGILNKKITDIGIIERNHRYKVIHDETNPKNEGNFISDWELNGIGFYIESEYIAVENGLDENIITTDINKDCRIIKLK